MIEHGETGDDQNIYSDMGKRGREQDPLLEIDRDHFL